MAVLPMAGAFLAFDNADTWVLFAFIVFVGVLLYVGVPGFIGSALDARAERIRDQIAQARSLREEAQRKLAEAERQLKDAEGKAREITERAKAEAVASADQAQKDMEAAVKRRLQSATDKIARAETDAVRAVRNAAVDAAVGAVQDVMRSGDSMIDDAVGEVSRQLAS